MNPFYRIPDTSSAMYLDDDEPMLNEPRPVGKRKYVDSEEAHHTAFQSLEDTIKRCRITTTPGEIR